MRMLHSTHADTVLVKSRRVAYQTTQRLPETVAKDKNESFMFA
jgi:hypothetical protein